MKCEPEVHDVQSLVDALNASNDFSAFVRNMRKRFQQLVPPARARARHAPDRQGGQAGR